ncbi:methionyl aminopeptidase [Clostridium tagluense]|uniref:methionyl aminopeptidase n=1 Tax=Clostridium TaxID=1485 RepID=UPI0013E93400|nr:MULTISPECIES: methionyl aminopeptidase [Clostridium]MBU3129050.1 methionyl aminopeptidase [Clostridium tagluense]MBW9156136.1 methionyl aminopeptidase [Clostridium tagluense]MBZ9625889.1 methionyl aminopeptidase [Clostridium sp. FP2]MCB2311278.1 methionyl aminopeptidase [Clostridium tagluense]MCB2316080.1 methionyl aminopeptidase [Clostridium tagluense]
MSILSRNDICWCGSGKKYKKCHMEQDIFISNIEQKVGYKIPRDIMKTEEQIDGIRKSCKLTHEILDMVGERIKVGVTTNEINTWVHEYTVEHNAYPAPLGYGGFPKSVCTSINDVICHGIPDDTVLKDGDIVNVDVTCILDGYYGDANRMFIMGEASKEAIDLVRVSKECLDLGIQQVKPYNTLGDIGNAIQEHAESHGYSVVYDYGGHGVGLEFHEEPFVPHIGKKGEGTILLPNMTFTIEPMLNIGSPEADVLEDDWTAVTIDGSLSSQWEHTIRVTETGYEILT